jgi:Cu+-exporting ATPase
MDSLVSLGSISAFTMSILLMIAYQAESNSMTDSSTRSEQIMNITHMYESTALILTVITIGKFFEGFLFIFNIGRAKKTILTMQQRIFPSDQLLRTTHYTYIEPKNQKFMIDS